MVGSNKTEIDEVIQVKIGFREVPIKVSSIAEKMFKQLVADQVHKKFEITKELSTDAFTRYALTALEFAEEKLDLEKKLDDKINFLETKVANLIEQIDAVLKEE